MMNFVKVSLATLAISVAAMLPAAAAVIDLVGGSVVGTGYEADGFLFDPARVVSGSGNGNCGYLGGGTCLAFNTNETTTMTTYDPAGGIFNLNSLSFVLVGNTAELSVFNTSITATGVLIISFDVGDAFGAATINNNTAYTYDFNGSADGVTSILFDNTGRGNVRIGSIDADLAAIPVPAAGFLLVGALGGLAALRRRRKLD